MSNSQPIPISESGQNNPNAYHNQAFDRSSTDLTNSPQSPPYYLDPRSPRAVFPVPEPMQQSPLTSTTPRNRTNERPAEEIYLHKEIIGQVLEDMADGHDLSIWGFLTYMEYNRTVASIYTKGQEFHIDNSQSPMDYDWLGLASLPRPANSKAQDIRQAVDKGIILSHDEEGNVYITNESKVPVIVKGFQEPENYCTSEEVIRRKGIIQPGEEVVKVFDIKEFRDQIGLQMLNGYRDNEQLRYMSVIRMCFGQAQPGLNSPSWLLILNLKALKMIDDEQVRTEIQEYIAGLTVTKDKPAEKNLPSKTQKNQGNQEARRKIRIELMKQKKTVGEHMKYSWDDVYYKKTEQSSFNLDHLKEHFEDPEIDYNKESDEDENTQQDGSQQELVMQKLKTLATSNQQPTSATPISNIRPTKHWAKLSYMLKKHSDD